jgi:hypothetical protein
VPKTKKKTRGSKAKECRADKSGASESFKVLLSEELEEVLHGRTF